MPIIIQSQALTVVAIFGPPSYVRGADGKMRMLKLGDMVRKGDHILTTQSGIVELRDANDKPTVAKPAATDPNAIIEALNQDDPSAATAAGINAGEGGDFQPGLRVDRISEGITPASIRTSGIERDSQVVVERATEPQSETALPAAAPVTARSTSISAVEEGAPIGLGLGVPVSTAQVTITVNAVPQIGQVLRPNGSAVTLGSVLTPDELAGLVYVPPAEYDGVAPIGNFGYTVVSAGLTTTGGTSITVAPLNDAPVATSGAATGAEDSAIPIGLAGRDTDGTVVGVTVTSLPTGGTLTLADGVTPVTVGQLLTPGQAAALLLRLGPDFAGSTSIGFTVTDNQGAVSTPAPLTITVTPVNDLPVASPDSAVTPEDTPVNGNLLGNDRDIDGPTLSVTQFSVGGSSFAAGSTATLPGVGTLVVNADGSYAFTPVPNFSGAVPAVGYTVSDGSLSSSSSLSLSVTAVNDAPLAVNDSFATDEDTPVTLGIGALLGNDSDPEGSALTLVSVQAPVNGTVALVGGNVVFTPEPDYNGPASFTYTVSDGQGGTSTATVAIDVRPVVDPAISISDVTVNEAAGTATFVVTLSQATTATVTVGYNSAAGTAGASDFSAVSGSLSFAPGVVSQTITVPIADDTVFEGSESFTINLVSPVNATLGDSVGVGTIADDGTGTGGSNDDTPALSVSAGNSVEGAPAVFTVSLSNASTSPVVFTPSLTSGSGIVGTDTATLGALEVSTDGGSTWNPASGNVIIAAGATSVQLRLPTTDDAISESPESFTLTATPVSGATATSASAIATIIDNDGPPTLFIDDVVVNEAAGTAIFTVSLSTASGLPVTVNFATADGSAGAADYTSTSGALTFAPGVTSQTVTVPIANDAVFEGGESFSVNLSAPVNATIADGTGIGTIADDGTGTGGGDNDTPRVLGVSSPTVAEGGNLDFSVTLSNSSTTATTVALTLASGSATLGTDTGGVLISFNGGASFGLVSGSTVSVPAVASSFIVRVPSTDDVLSESAETLTLTASTSANAAPVVGTGTITDNDGTPTLSISGPVTVNEVAGTLTYTVALSNPSASTVTVTASTASGTATSGADFTAAATSLTFAPGVTSQTVTVSILDDAVFEGSETFSVALSAPTNASIGTGSVTTTIADDGTGTGGTNNDTPSLTLTGPAVIDEAAGTATYTVTLSNASASTVTVAYATSDASANAGADYAATSGTLSFAPGVLVQTITVPINNDTALEGSESFALSLSAPAGATIATGSVTSSIVDDGRALPGGGTANNDTPGIAVTAAPVIEGGQAVFTVSLSNLSTSPVVFTPSLSNGTATLGTDTAAASALEYYNGSAWQPVSGNVTIPAGAPSIQLRLATTDDAISEGNETFTLTATPVSGAIPGAVSATASIGDNEGAPQFSINDVSVNEGAGTITFMVSLSNPSANAVTVDYAAASGTASLPGDVSAGSSAISGTLSFAAGVTSQTVTLNVANDDVFEGSESFTVTLSGASAGTTIADGSGVGTILDTGTGGGGTDNDTPRVVSVSSPTVTEGDNLDFSVVLSNTSTTPTTVTLTPASGSAVLGTDTGALEVSFDGGLNFVPVSGSTVSVPAGSGSFIVRVPSVADTIDEPNETMTLSASTLANVAPVAGIGTLTDNDAAPTVASVSNPTVTEGSNLVYTVGLTNASASVTTFPYTLGGGSAAASDFGTPSFSNGVTLAAGVLTIPAGVTSFTVTVPTTQDVLSEGNETVPLVVGGVTGTGTINDNDPQPAISINDLTITEGTATTPATATFTLSLSAPSGQTVTVGYNTANGTAASGADYTSRSGTVTFAPGETSATISVPILADTTIEASETFTVNLVTPVNATIADAQGVASIVDNDAPPVIDLDADNSSGATGANFTLSYTENGSALALVDTDVSITNGESTTLTSATVTLTNAQAGDVLAIGTLPAGISASLVGNVVTLSGTATLASYQTALRAITFANSSDAPSTTARTITVAVTDGVNVSNTATTTINVVAVNDLPSGIDRAVTTGEDVPYRFSSSDFRMNDAEDGANSAAAAVRIDSLPANGTLTLNGAAVSAGQILTAAQVGLLTFTPAANASGATYASFNFSVSDSSGAFDPSANAMTIAVSPRADLAVRDVQHWTFNEGSGATTTNIYPSADQTGTRTDGIAGGTDRSPSFTADGHQGAGMQFNGTWNPDWYADNSARDGGYVALASSVTDPLRGNGTGGGSASLVFWIRTTQTGSGIGWDSPSVIGMENNGGVLDVQWGWINNAGRIGFGIANEPGVLSANPVNDGNWHNVAITHNFATGATEVWVDGVLSGSGSVLPGAIIPNSFLGFGVTADDGATRDRYLNATLDDVRIYDRTLTATQIQAIYAVENNNLGASAVLDNDGGPVRFTVAADDYTQLTVSGAPVGSSLTDGTNTVAITTAGQTVDVTGWNLSEIAVTGMGTNSALLAVTATGATGGDSATQFVNIVTGSSIFNGTDTANTLTGSASADFIGGGGGDDTISANAGDDRIFGGTGNDTINAGAGNDVIVGGAGNDTMTGGAGADVFQWQLADRGTAGAPATDTITDFDPAARSAGGDVLDLRDLLVGENRSGGTGNLDSYLDFDTVSTPGSTIIRISSTGGFTGGSYAAGQEDERITLTGVDLRASFGLGAAATDAQIIQELLNRNKIVTDGP